LYAAFGAEVKTGVTIEPELWDKESQSITGSSPLLKQYNATLVGFATQAWTCYTCYNETQ